MQEAFEPLLPSAIQEMSAAMLVQNRSTASSKPGENPAPVPKLLEAINSKSAHVDSAALLTVLGSLTPGASGDQATQSQIP